VCNYACVTRSKKLKELMEHATQFPEEYSKVSSVQKKVGRRGLGLGPHLNLGIQPWVTRYLVWGATQGLPGLQAVVCKMRRV
jgi:hypothetical protein